MTKTKAKPRVKAKAKSEPTVWTARPTVYRGIQMRSRLEAAWAEQLDAFGIEWQYEPGAYGSEEGQYLPDFLLAPVSSDPPDTPLFLEVKPYTFFSEGDRTPLCGRMLRILRASMPKARLWIVTNAADDGLIRGVEVLLTDRGNECFEFLNFGTAAPVASLYARGFWKRPG